MTDSAASSTEPLAFLPELRREMARVLIGQDELVDALLIGLLTGGHVLVEGLPGLAKTLAVKALAATVGGTFSRIQFTPDLLPADIIGTYAYRPDRQAFEVRPGPIAANIVLADEINRAPAKVQSALLEAMQERQVTIAGQPIPLPDPFLVAATQNPIEHSGTFILPEAQKDRFMLQVVLDYPGREQEGAIIDQHGRTSSDITLKTVASLDDIRAARTCVDAVYLDGRLRDYILDIAIATRPGRQEQLSARQNRKFLPIADLVEAGASPRATIALTLAAKARAALQGRRHVLPQDVKACAGPVLAHRIVTTFEADAQNMTARTIVARLVAELQAP